MSNFLQPTDIVGFTYFATFMALVATTVFLLFERSNVNPKWQTSLTIAALVTGIAAFHYYYMKEVWVETASSPIVFRYIDWIITVPLQIVEFYFILAAVAVVSSSIFYRLLIPSIIMLLGGYFGEAGILSPTVGFIIGMIGWLIIIYEIFAGEASKINASNANESSQYAFKTVRAIVTFGWAIYPIGYFLGYFTGGDWTNTLNIVYNVADFVNKIAFSLVIYQAAKMDTK